ncbi:MAG: YIP1 family protein [Ktedonobacteraceae bacterium]|nr:YIP1 family protein [Ktedonobacteraceae bacterium]MBO0790069.1 YIP1 family protein [Ktedonobacteraceae bacterium]
MSQDPNSSYGSNPQNPYGAPQNPYGAQQNPYGTGQPPQDPYSGGQQQQAVPQDPYSAQQNPYGAQQNPYGAQANPYGAQQPPYGAGQTFYGAPGQQMPLGDAIKQLPNQYIKVLTKPSVASFVEELPRASWDSTWIQILIMALATVIVGLISSLLLAGLYTAGAAATGDSSAAAMGAAMSMFTATTNVGFAFGKIILVPLGFFIGVGIQYLLAKAFGGQGTFLGQSYTTLLYQVPLNILGALVALIPILGGIVGFAIFIYAIVLNVFQIQASHRLSGGKATWVVLIPYLAGIVLFLLCAVLFAGLIYAILSGSH